jgi:hypothetical protein
MLRCNAPFLKICVGSALAATLMARPAAAITFGEPDSDNQFPNVGAIVAVRDSSIVATGILIHPRVLLTAGHATADIEFLVASGIATHDDGRVSFGVDATDPSTWHEIETVVTHPDYRLYPESSSQDIGVVILKEPVDLPCATLPYVGLLDDLKHAGLLRDAGLPTQFLNVGYGATLDFPPPEFQEGDGLRRFSISEYQALQNVWLMSNQNPAAGAGGVGYGDSGGPKFWPAPNGELVLVGIQSRSPSPEVVGVVLCYRLDIAEAHEFVEFVLDFVNARLP